MEVQDNSDDSSGKSRKLLPHLLYYEVTVPVTEEGLMIQLTKWYEGAMFGVAMNATVVIRMVMLHWLNKTRHLGGKGD